MKLANRLLILSLYACVACDKGAESTNPEESQPQEVGPNGLTPEEQAELSSTSTEYDPSDYEDTPSAYEPAKQKKGKKKLKKRKNTRKGATAKKRKKRNKKNKFNVALDGVLPTAAPKGAFVEVFGSGLDRKDLVVAIGNKPQKIVKATEDRVVFKVTGGKGKVALGKLDANKKFKSFEQTSYAFEVLGKGGLGQRTNVDQGLIGNVYLIDGEVTELPQFSGEPAATIAVDQLDIVDADFKTKIAGRNAWFGVHFRGSLNLVKAGDYEFCLNSDDGAQLYLDEGLILNNDGVHEAAEVCESFTVEPGEYQLDLLWFQAERGPMALQLTWSRDGGKKTPIPVNAFFPPEDAADMAR